MLVAAEASGDVLGAGLAQALRRRMGEAVRFVGVGGARMREAGVDSPFDIAELSVLGLVEGVAAYRRVVLRADETAALAARERPDAAVLIDSWGFTLRVAQRLRKLEPGLPLIKYVGPQVWASRPGRAKTLAQAVDHLLALHSFDPPWFEREGLPVTFVGNPALHRDFGAADGARLRAKFAIAPDAPVLLVLPGSRPAEVNRLREPFGDAVRRLKAGRPELQVLFGVAETVAADVRAWAAEQPLPVHLIEGEGDRLDAMKAADVALACSGTVSTELALAGCPMVIGYRLGGLTYLMLKPLIRTRWITLFNIAAQDFVAPEFVQGECTGPKLAAALAARLGDPELRARQVAAQNAALDRMGRGGPDPAEAAAEAVLKVLAGRSGQPRWSTAT
jgi:lipid-A-disaccharide synthase